MTDARATGLTIRAFAMHEFFIALEDYRTALQSKQPAAIVRSSVRVHIALGGVPQRMRRLVTRAFRTGGAE